jgi:uncharacterized protein
MDLSLSKIIETAPDQPRICWVVTDGSAGMENQCLGLAEAMGIKPEIKRIQTRKIWSFLPPLIWHKPLKKLKNTGDILTKPWPNILITCGRQAIPMSLAIRKASKGKCFTIHIQTPNCSARHFDLVIVPEHDQLRGENILVSRGSLTRITPKKLKSEEKKFEILFREIGTPIYAILVGGSNRCYDVTPQTMHDLCKKLEDLHHQKNCHFLVTTSRRTGTENEAILKQTLSKVPHYLWDGTGENPYFAFLSKADAIIVTADSVNMVCEAATTGKPVLVFDLPGGNRKFNFFHKSMGDAGYTHAFNGAYQAWDPPKLDETNRIASMVAEIFAKS